MSKALIVVDVQVDFCEGGALAVNGGNEVAARIAKLLVSDHGYARVVATRDHHLSPGSHFSPDPDYVDSWPPHCVAGTPGQELHPALRNFPFAAVFDKGSYSAAYSGFEGTIGGSDDGMSLADWLHRQGIDAVDICGLATDYCVRETAADAAQRGLTTAVLADLTAPVHATGKDTTRAALGDQVAWVVELVETPPTGWLSPSNPHPPAG